jgi:N-acetylglucosamine kinase-like BadF-type ATPase
MLETEIYRPLLGNIPYVLKNDSFAALRGGIRSPAGIVIVCGTGSVCAGRAPDGREDRVGGIGPAFGDACTGNTLSDAALQTVWRARDGIEAPTLLTEAVLERAGVPDADALFDAVYSGRVPRDSLFPLTRELYAAAAEADSAAVRILAEGGTYLAKMVLALAQRLGLEAASFELVTAGGVFRGEPPVLREAMVEQVHTRYEAACAVFPEFEPVIGALLLGLELEGAISENMYKVLERSLPRVEKRHHIELRRST